MIQFHSNGPLPSFRSNGVFHFSLCGQDKQRLSNLAQRNHHLMSGDDHHLELEELTKEQPLLQTSSQAKYRKKRTGFPFKGVCIIFFLIILIVGFVSLVCQCFDTRDYEPYILFEVNWNRNSKHFTGIVAAGGEPGNYKCQFMGDNAYDCFSTKTVATITFTSSGPRYETKDLVVDATREVYFSQSDVVTKSTG
jgi:hypothetical protein